jgi:hypothetical protein
MNDLYTLVGLLVSCYLFAVALNAPAGAAVRSWYRDDRDAK